MNFTEAKQRKERGVSVQQVVDALGKESKGLTSIVVAAVDQEKGVLTAYSGDSPAELIGLAEVVKAELVDEIRD